MRVFISHSMNEVDQHHFENVAGALRDKGIDYWEPASIEAGKPLRAQLGIALRSCEVCIFIATARSVTRPWCLSEISAFWGRRRPVIVYRADQTLDVGSLPELVRHDVFVDSVPRALAMALENLAAHDWDDADEPTSTGTIPVGLLPDIIDKVLDRLDARDRAARPYERSPEATRTATMQAVSDAIDTDRRDRILWIDEPERHKFERKRIRGRKFLIDVAGSTEEAVMRLGETTFMAAVSVLPEAGLVDGGALGDVPLFIYAGRRSAVDLEKARERGAQATNRLDDLLSMLIELREPSD